MSERVFKNRYRKKKFYRKKNNYNFSNKQINIVKGIVNKKLQEIPEKKYYDTTVNSSIGFTPVFYNLTQISQGTTSYNRVGDDIQLLSIYIRLKLSIYDTTNIFRVVLFQWFDDGIDDAPAWEKIFQYPSTTAPTVPNQLMSPLAIDKNQNKFKILFDKYFKLDVDDQEEIMELFYKKNFNKKILYKSGSNFGLNHIYLMLVSDSEAVNHPTAAGYLRVRYTDF